MPMPSVAPLLSDIIQAALEARLSPLVSRVAVIVADIAGPERALGFIQACVREGEGRGLELLDVGTVLR